MHGVLTGIDYEEWNPETDPDIAAHYGLNRVEKKWINKNALQKENDFRIDPSIPLVGLISRLVDQKGLDILIPAMERFPDFGVQFVLLGTGEEKYHRILRDIAKKNLETFGIHIVFDSKMAKRIYAGADMLLLPSVYEPCGLGQMIALRYGTVPIGRETGGLADTIADFEPVTGRGNGFLFREHSTANLLEAIERALAVYRDAARWKRLVTNAMASDFSWTASAKRYVEIFRELAGGRRAVD
jgi:starch synthase